MWRVWMRDEYGNGIFNKNHLDTNITIISPTLTELMSSGSLICKGLCFPSNQHRSWVKNKVANALRRRNSLLTILHVTIPGFYQLKELYEGIEDFSTHWEACSKGMGQSRFHIQKGFLFFVPRSSMTIQIIQEVHNSRLSGHLC